MKITITKHFKFDAAHSLPHLPATHKCHHLHGHTYGITLHCTGEMAGEWLIDYADIASAWQVLHNKLDHHNLDDILPCATTAENLAIWIAVELKKDLPMLSKVEVQETATSNVILDVTDMKNICGK